MKYIIDDRHVAYLRSQCVDYLQPEMLEFLADLKPLQPMTDEEMQKLWPIIDGTNSVQFVMRLVEKHHGIGE